MHDWGGWLGCMAPVMHGEGACMAKGVCMTKGTCMAKMCGEGDVHGEGGVYKISIANG